MQTSLHIKALVAELQKELAVGKIVNSEFYKKERSAYFFVKGTGTLWALGVVFHPSGSGCFLVPASKLKIDTREKPWPIFALAGGEISSVIQPLLDRIFFVEIAQDHQRLRLAVEAIGPNSNIWLLDSESRKQGTLRNRDYVPGEPYTPFTPMERLDPLQLPPAALLAEVQKIAEEAGSTHIGTFVEKRILGFNKTMAREAAKRSECDDLLLSDFAEGDSERLAKVIQEMAGRFDTDAVGYLYQIHGGFEAYPFKLSSVEVQPEKFKSLSFAIMEMVARRQTAKEEVSERDTTAESVVQGIKRLEKRIHKVEQDIKEAENYELLKQQAELLQINRHLIKRGMKSVTVDNVYDAERRPMEIPIDPALTLNDNIEHYFKRYRKGREGLELLQRRLEISVSELEELKRMQVDLDRHFDSASEKYQAELTALRPREAGEKSAPAPRLPYKPYQLSTGLTIYVGRDGSDNDRTTFEFAKPYELWFHTQQCPGSHVVIKFPNKSFQPSKAEIEETASIAAHFSKARNDSLVPVIYAERRYVRKPRNAKPGLVVVDREKSIMVKPTKPAER
jgi:predicted ribosome quality control (RQC) complex YloA/Tae2 family protein